MHKEKITDRCKGRWKSILVRFGIDEKVLDGKHHKCPVTGDGEDRFRFSNRNGRGSFFCACNDGKGDGFQLLCCKLGLEFKDAAKAVEEVIGETEEDEAGKERSAEQALADLKRLQQAVMQPTDNRMMLDYLSSRAIPERGVPTSVLRQARVSYGLRKIGITGLHDAMVAKFSDATGQPSTFHITYLKDGKKAEFERNRVVATPARKMLGGAVRLMKINEDGVLGVAEGIETALSARVLFNVPVWATLNAQMLEQFQPPPECKKLLVFGDNDRSFTGHAASYALAKHCRLRWKVDVEVHIPPDVGHDWNDVLRSRR